jgi:phenylalanyl-tRNA synthetase alpha subunit
MSSSVGPDPGRAEQAASGAGTAVSAGAIDVTLPGVRPRLGHRHPHPLTQTVEELIDQFGRFSFSVARGPEVEDVRHTFEALNLPLACPARDPLDNFSLAGRTMLRSRTSTVQIRVKEQQPPRPPSGSSSGCSSRTTPDFSPSSKPGACSRRPVG